MLGEVGGPRRIAIVGKPNVGKSSLLNQLAQEDRVVVDNVAGTTVDPVDELIELGGRTWRFIDTAGIRKRVKEASGHEYYASLRTSTAIDRAEVAVLVIDGGESISEQDLRIIQTIREAGRALVIAFNKWDLVDEERRYYLEREIERDLVQVQWAPRINVTARTGWHIDRLVPALDKALAGWETRIPTGQLNAFLGPPRRRAPAPGAQRQAAEDPLRHPGLDRAADVRAVHQRQAGRRLRALHRAPPARGVRLRRHPDRAAAASAGEAEALAAVRRVGLGRRPGGATVGMRRVLVLLAAGSWRAVGGAAGDGHVVPVPSRTTTTGTPTSGLPVHPRSRQWLRTCRSSVHLHPDFGPSYGAGPDYGIPITVVAASHRRVKVHFEYAGESDRVRYPLGGDTRIEGGRDSTGDRHAIVVDRGSCRLYETWRRADRHGAGEPAPAPSGPWAATPCDRTAGRRPTQQGCRSCRACCAGTR